MSPAHARLAAALGAALALATGCDDLGNPPPVPPTRGRTPLVEWQSPAVALRTESVTIPAAEADALLRALPPSALAHREHADTGAVTLVTVTPRWARPVSPGVVPLVTQLRLPDGSIATRRWSAPTTQRRWQALFALPAAPTEVATAVP